MATTSAVTAGFVCLRSPKPAGDRQTLLQSPPHNAPQLGIASALRVHGRRRDALQRQAPRASVADRLLTPMAPGAARRSNLTDEAIDRAQAIWTIVTAGASPKETAAKTTAGGLLLFRNLFQMDPSLLELFPFKKKTGQAYEKALAAHANDVMSTVDYVIVNLRDVGTLIPVLQDNHSRHIGVRNPTAYEVKQYGVTIEHYNTLAAALLVTFAQALGRELTLEEKAAYGDVMALITDAARDVEAARK